MGWLATPELSKKCKRFVMAHWGKDGLQQVMDHPVSWVRHEANPQLKVLRRKRKHLPLIAVRGGENRIHLALSTEKKGRSHV
jgi:hypothetical protein